MRAGDFSLSDYAALPALETTAQHLRRKQAGNPHAAKEEPASRHATSRSVTGTLTNEVLVRPGDWLFGDVDGVLVIPQEILPEAVEKVTELSRLERMSREAFRKGANFREVYEKFQRA